MYKVYDDVLPEKLFNKIKNILTSDLFPWYSIESTAYKPSDPGAVLNQSHHSFVNAPMLDSKNTGNSPLADLLDTALLVMLDKTDEDISALGRIRIGLLTYVGEQIIHKGHTDDIVPHKVALFYINNSDAPTYLYKEKYDITSNKQSSLYLKENLNDNLTVETKIECKANRLVIFDGFQYHSSSSPTNIARRIVINYNFRTKDMVI
jgi:hypothetical protein